MNNKRRYFKMACLASVTVLLGACSTPPPHGKPSGSSALHAGNANYGAITNPARAYNTSSTGTPVVIPVVIPAPIPITIPAPIPIANIPAPIPVMIPAPIPVVTPAPIPTASNNANVAGSYVVKKGDTVYAVMRQTGVYWKKIASMNNLQAPYVIHPGQALRLR